MIRFHSVTEDYDIVVVNRPGYKVVKLVDPDTDKVLDKEEVRSYKEMGQYIGSADLFEYRSIQGKHKNTESLGITQGTAALGPDYVLPENREKTVLAPPSPPKEEKQYTSISNDKIKKWEAAREAGQLKKSMVGSFLPPPLYEDREGGIFGILDWQPRRRLHGVILAEKRNNENVYKIKTALKERNLIGITKAVQFALGIKYNGTDTSAMDRGTRIHTYLDEAIKKGSKTIQVSPTLMNELYSFNTPKKPKERARAITSIKGTLMSNFTEMLKAQEALDYIHTNFPSGEGWKIKSEYKVSDYREYASSIDVLVVNETRKEAVILDLKTGKTNIPYVTAQTSIYRDFLRNEKRFSGYKISTGVIGFSQKTGEVEVKKLSPISKKEISRILYPSYKEGFGYLYQERKEQSKTITDVFNPSEMRVLPFAKGGLKGIFNTINPLDFTREGDVVSFDIETMPLKNGRMSLRSVSMLTLSQHRDKEGNVTLGHRGLGKALYERAFLSDETFNSTSNLTQKQINALELHKLSDSAVINFEKAYGRTASVATTKDILDIMKRMSHKTVIGHNIINFDFSVMFYTGMETAYKEGGEAKQKEFIRDFEKYFSTMSVIDTFDLAKIIQENNKDILPEITNSALLKTFNPATYAKLREMLHQSSTDVVATAKTFETLLNIMSPAERDILFNIVKKTGKKKNLFSYTVLKGTPNAYASAEPFIKDVGFSLEKTNRFLLGEPTNIDDVRANGIKVSKLFEEKLYTREAFSEIAEIRQKFKVYFNYKDDKLFFDMPLYEAMAKKRADEYIAAVKKDSAYFSYDYTDIINRYIDRQQRDYMILSKLGERNMAFGDSVRQAENKAFEAVIDSLAEALGNIGSDRQAATIFERLTKMSITDAANLYEHPDFVEKLYTRLNRTPDEAVKQAFKSGLEAKLGLSVDQVLDKFLGMASSGMFGYGTISEFYNSQGFADYVSNLTPMERYNLVKRGHAAQKQFNYWKRIDSDFAKFSGAGELADALVLGDMPIDSFRDSYSRVFHNAKSYAFGITKPLYADSIERASSVYKELGSKLLPGVLRSVTTNPALQDIISDDISASGFTGFLKDNLSLASSYGAKIGLTDDYKQGLQEQILDAYFKGNPLSIKDALKLADTLLIDQKGRASFWEDVQHKEKIKSAARITDYEAKAKSEAQIEAWTKETGSRRFNAERFITQNMMFSSDKQKLLDATNAAKISSEEYAQTLTQVHDNTVKLNRVLGATVGTLKSIPFYNPDQLFAAGYHQIGNIHKSLNGVIPSFLNTSVTKMLMGGVQDYELGWQKWKYGLKSATPALSLIGGTLGAVAGAPFGASMQMGAMGASALGGLGAWASQIVGNRYERAINETGLFFSSRFNKMGAMITPAIAALNLFTKALKIASVPLLAGLGSGLYMYKRALNNMGTLDTPLYNLTDINYGMGYNQLSRLDYTFGMKRGTTNNIIEGVEFAKQGLLSLGRYDKNKLISSALLGIFNEAYMNPGDGASNYAAMTSKLYENYQNSKNKGRFMYLLNEYNPELAKQLQIRTEYESFLASDRGAPYRNRRYYYNDINRDQRNEFRAITGIQSSFGESIQNSFMKIAAALYNWKGFDFMNRYTSVIGNAADAFAGGDINGGFKVIGDGIIDFIDNLGKTWTEVKEKLGISGLKDTILTYGKVIYHEIKLKLIDLGLFVTDIFGKLKDPAKGFFMMLYEQFKKLFDFVGQIRLQIDWDKLKSGDMGGLQFKFGYESGGYKDAFDSFAGKKSSARIRDKDSVGLLAEAAGSSLFKKLDSVYSLSLEQGIDNGEGFYSTSNASGVNKALFILRTLAKNNLPFTEEGLQQLLKNRSSLNRNFSPTEKSLLNSLADDLGIAKASDSLDKTFTPIVEEVINYFTGGRDIGAMAKDKLEEAKEKETKLILEFKNDQGKSEQHELIIGQQTGIVEVFGPNWKWGVR